MHRHIQNTDQNKLLTVNNNNNVNDNGDVNSINDCDKFYSEYNFSVFLL